MGRSFGIGKRPGAGGAVFKRSGAQSVGSFLGALTKPAFEKFGFPTAALLTDWATIVGRDVAAYTAPERLKWPRNANSIDVDGTQKKGATLILRVSGPRAIELQHQTTQLLDRINSYFGFCAVSSIRFIQAPVEYKDKKPSRRRVRRAASPEKIERLKEVKDERLRRALTRIAASIEA